MTHLGILSDSNRGKFFQKASCAAPHGAFIIFGLS